MTRMRCYLAPLLWATLLLALGSVPDVPAPAPSLPLDKLAHLLLYGVLGLLLGRGWLRAGRRPAAALLIAGAALIAALDELHQAAVPGRSPDALDWLMDLAGILAGFALAPALRRPRSPMTADE